MIEGWTPRFKGPIDGRFVELFQYEDSQELKVKTTQHKTETTRGSYEPGSTIFPSVISEGDEIVIEGATADQLVIELVNSGFSETGAREIARHGRIP